MGGETVNGDVIASPIKIHQPDLSLLPTQTRNWGSKLKHGGGVLCLWPSTGLLLFLCGVSVHPVLHLTPTVNSCHFAAQNLLNTSWKWYPDAHPSHSQLVDVIFEGDHSSRLMGESHFPGLWLVQGWACDVQSGWRLFCFVSTGPVTASRIISGRLFTPPSS